MLVAHGLLTGPDLYRYGTTTLVDALRRAGFAPYLFTHRGDRYAIAPPGQAPSPDPEAIVERDLPAALAAVAAHAGFERVHLVGHGFGGLLAMAVAMRRPPALASVIALGAPVVGNRALPHPGLGAAAARLVPGDWRVPLRFLARWGAIFVSEEDGRARAFDLARQSVPARLRGALVYTADDAPIRLVLTMRGWLSADAALYGGAVELGAGLAGAEVPLLVVTGTEDPICPPAAGEAALAGWGHPDRRAIRAPGSHLDLLLGVDAPEQVFAPIVAWLSDRRRLSWASHGARDPIAVSS